ncbi:MAG: type II toxin-antitoxin system RelE/ParE family toxin [Chloroflexia bacterium]|nr:type II toxin-antitoxin system RelE/ParE family toxin [Chloroflexia bacterium]
MSDDRVSPFPVFFTSEFKRNLRQLAKKYRRIRTDIQPLLNDLEAGNVPGDQIQGLDVLVFKVRARNTDSARGKSGGYRIIYQKKPDKSIVLITIYSKSEQADISVAEIQAIVTAYKNEQAP